MKQSGVQLGILCKTNNYDFYYISKYGGGIPHYFASVFTSSYMSYSYSHLGFSSLLKKHNLPFLRPTFKIHRVSDKGYIN